MENKALYQCLEKKVLYSQVSLEHTQIMLSCKTVSTVRWLLSSENMALTLESKCVFDKHIIVVFS